MTPAGEGFAAAPGAAIETERLTLALLVPETLRALLAHDLPRASASQGTALPPDFLSEDGALDPLLAFHHQQVRDHPDVRGWCLRAMVRRSDGEVVGSCGFHGPPRAVGRAEIGYAVQAPARGNGYASEAAAALVRWAFDQGEERVFASVAPTNAASLAVVRKVGFVEVGVQRDDAGAELVFEIRRT